MTYSYQLKKEKGGPRPERTYELTAEVPRPNDPRASNRRGAPQTARRQNAPPPPTVRRRQVSSGYSQSGNGIVAERTYEFDINMPRPRQSAPKRPSRPAQAAHYVLNKNGRRVLARSEAEYLAIKKERDEALRREYKRMLEETAAARAESSIRTVAAGEKKPFPKRFIAAAAVCTLLFMYIVYNMVMLNERSREISALKSQVSELSATKQSLTDELAKKNDLIYIEDYAVNVLGMVKSDRLSRQYISIETSDKIEVVGEDEQQSESTTGIVINKFKSQLEDFWEYIS